MGISKGPYRLAAVDSFRPSKTHFITQPWILPGTTAHRPPHHAQPTEPSWFRGRVPAGSACPCVRRRPRTARGLLWFCGYQSNTPVSTFAGLQSRRIEALLPNRLTRDLRRSRLHWCAGFCASSGHFDIQEMRSRKRDAAASFPSEASTIKRTK